VSLVGDIEKYRFAARNSRARPMWRECAEKHAVFQCCQSSVPASTFRASAERLAGFIGSGTSKAIDLRGETPVRAPFSSVRAPDMRFRQLSRDRVPACSLCTNPASAEGMAWFARSDASKSLDSGRKTASFNRRCGSRLCDGQRA
jgi:hypothetical protein